MEFKSTIKYSCLLSNQIELSDAVKADNVTASARHRQFFGMAEFFGHARGRRHLSLVFFGQLD
jgi:hypothetical protein